MAITYHDLYLKTRMALSSAGIEAAQLEAREILCAAAEKTAEELYRDISLYTTDAIAEKTEALQARRLAGEPIAYLLGEWSFCGLPFFVSPAALIPAAPAPIMICLMRPPPRSKWPFWGRPSHSWVHRRSPDRSRI